MTTEGLDPLLERYPIADKGLDVVPLTLGDEVIGSGISSSGEPRAFTGPFFQTEKPIEIILTRTLADGAKMVRRTRNNGGH